MAAAWLHKKSGWITQILKPIPAKLILARNTKYRNTGLQESTQCLPILTTPLCIIYNYQRCGKEVQYWWLGLINLSPAKKPLLPTSSWRCSHLHYFTPLIYKAQAQPKYWLFTHVGVTSPPVPVRKHYAPCYLKTITKYFPFGLVRVEDKCLTAAPPVLSSARPRTTFQVLEYPKSYYSDLCLSAHIL